MDEERVVKPWYVRLRDFVMTTSNGMAIGLFGTLIIGTIIGIFARIPGLETVDVWAKAIQGLMGAGIGLGVALSLKVEGVRVVALMAAGFVGNYAFHWISLPDLKVEAWTVTSIGDPLSCYLSVLAAFFVAKLVMRKKTPVDLILIPLVALITAILNSFLIAEWIHFVTIGISKVIEVSFQAVPFLMCIIVSVLMGMALTAPISSVAIGVAIQIGSVPLAAASALIGCCTQMVGFAVHTARDNKWGSVLAVGLGTSMLQFKNIVRKPFIWVPTIIVSAILGPFAMLFPMAGSYEAGLTQTLSVGAGMGTSGLVGPINFLSILGFDSWKAWLLIVGFCILAPLVLVFLLDLLFRKIGLLKEGDFSLKAEI